MMLDFASRRQTLETLPISDCQLPILRPGVSTVLITSNRQSEIGNAGGRGYIF
jgi:hypothetical protein